MGLVIATICRVRRTIPKPAVRLINTPCWSRIPDNIKQTRGLYGDELTIELTKGYWALISPEDTGLASYNWFSNICSTTVYATRWAKIGEGRSKSIGMHSQILGEPEEVDHRDQYVLLPYGIIDNRRENLRAVTRTQNHANRRKSPNCTSRYKGVRMDKRKPGKWRVTICVNYQLMNLGTFANQESAALAYNEVHARFFPDIPEGRNQL